MASQSRNQDLVPCSTEDRLLSRIMGTGASYDAKCRVHRWYVTAYPEAGVRQARLKSLLAGKGKRGVEPFTLLCHEAGAALVGAA